LKLKLFSSPSKSGFTLIEMLVVVAIIGLLVSLISGAVSKSLQRGKETTTISNLRQLGVASFTYSADNKGELVPHAVWDQSAGINKEWVFGYGFDDPQEAFKNGILGPYLSNAAQIVRDPTFEFKGDKIQEGPFGTYPTTFGFGYNGFYLSQKTTAYGQWKGHGLDTIDNPSRTVMFATSAQSTSSGVKSYENIWPFERLPRRVVRAVDGKNALVCWVAGNVSKFPLSRPKEYDGVILGHLEGESGENIFDRFDGDNGDK